MYGIILTTVQLRKDLAAFKDKVDGLSEETQTLRENLAQREKKIADIKKIQTGAQDAVIEVQKMKATRQQMLIASKQTFDELATEYTGM
jgi:uncharacterized coiled-coil DUF342 family protein